MEAKDDRSGCDNWSYKSCKVPVISLGDRKGIRPVKKTWVLVCWWWWFDWSFAWLMTYGSSSPVVTTTSIILCFNKHWLTQVHRENGRWNGERQREREREREREIALDPVLAVIGKMMLLHTSRTMCHFAGCLPSSGFFSVVSALVGAHHHMLH